MSYTAYTPRPGTSSRGASFVFDMNELARIKKGVTAEQSGQGEDNERGVAQQFEALFIQQMLKLARQSHMVSGLFNSDQSKMINSLGDEQMAMNLAAGGGMGLSQALVEIMNANKPKGPSGNQSAPVDAAARDRQTSRLSHLKSSMPREGEPIADSISDLLEMLGAGTQKTTSSLGTAKPHVSGALKTVADKVSSFIDRIGDAATAVAQQSGLPIELILSQAALESGWGEREIVGEDGSNSHNLFGIKATGSWKGQVVHVMTTEYVEGVPRKMMQPFRAYDSYVEALQDYARLLSNSPRYSAVRQAPTAQEAAIEVQRAGYATDPTYAEKLIRIMAYFKPSV